jgi:hypothetical protein
MVCSHLFENPTTLTQYFAAAADLVHSTQFALDVKAKTLPLYEKILDIEDPLPKLDTLVVGDFATGNATPRFLTPSGSYPYH